MKTKQATKDSLIKALHLLIKEEKKLNNKTSLKTWFDIRNAIFKIRRALTKGQYDE